VRARLPTIWAGLLLAAAIAGCARPQAAGETAVVQPTIAPIFDDSPELSATSSPQTLPTVSEATATTVASSTPAPTGTVVPTTAATSGAAEPTSPFVDVRVYDDALATGWNLRFSDGVNVNITSTSAAYDGLYSVQAAPIKAYSNLIFGVVRNAPATYKREDVLGVRFRVSGGDVIVPNDGLIVTVFGSKEYPYFVKGDTSATVPEGRVVGEEPLFPETRLYFLDVNRAIQPGEWAEVIVWLDEHFTPDYTYVTGIQIKNDELYMDPYYIDDVALILKQP
jgi:hypothetical protein